MARAILHIDMDSFHPSVEIRRNPALKGLPVIVGADPKEGRGRGVVTSCSYEARKYGVRSGQPISRAYKLCPQGIFLQPDFALYGEVSEKVMGILRKFADKFEQVSIDEAFIDATEKVKAFRDAQELAEKIKDEIHRSEGLTCSIGVAPNKSIAKIASAHRKPNGLTIVEPDRAKEFLAPLQVRSISGVGKKTEAYLRAMGIRTIGELAAVPGKELYRRFGKAGVWLWAIANGLEKAEVEERTEMKSMSADHTFEEDVSDHTLVLDTMALLIDEVHKRLQSEGLLFRTVGIRIRFEDFETFTREKSLAEYMSEKKAIIDTALMLLREFENDRRRVRLIGVRLSNLRKPEGEQKDLLAWA